MNEKQAKRIRCAERIQGAFALDQAREDRDLMERYASIRAAAAQVRYLMPRVDHRLRGRASRALHSGKIFRAAVMLRDGAA